MSHPVSLGVLGLLPSPLSTMTVHLRSGGFGPDSSDRGIYLFTACGTLKLVADASTLRPGTQETFSSGGPSLPDSPMRLAFISASPPSACAFSSSRNFMRILRKPPVPRIKSPLSGFCRSSFSSPQHCFLCIQPCYLFSKLVRLDKKDTHILLSSMAIRKPGFSSPGLLFPSRLAAEAWR
jgi:hypothetical protein